MSGTDKTPRKRVERLLVWWRGARHTRWGSVVLSVDFLAAVAVAAFAAVTAASWELKEWPATILLTLGGGMLALLAVTVTAAAALTALISDAYLALVQRAPGGLDGVTRPFRIVGWVCASGAILDFAGALVWPVANDSHVAAAIVLLVAAFASTWAIVGSAQLIDLTMFHLRSRGQLKDAMERIRRRT